MATATKSRKRRKSARSTQERAAAAQELRERLSTFEDETDEATMAAIFARFDGYSERNAMLIAMQYPEATDVSGFRAWKDRGRSVKAGEHGIRILAPAGHKDAVEADPDAGVEAQAERQSFRLVSVFDVSQTEPTEVAEARWAARQAEQDAADAAGEADQADLAAYGVAGQEAA